MKKETKDFATAAYWSAVAGTLIGLGLTILRGTIKWYNHRKD